MPGAGLQGVGRRVAVAESYDAARVHHAPVHQRDLGHVGFSRLAVHGPVDGERAALDDHAASNQEGTWSGQSHSAAGDIPDFNVHRHARGDAESC